ncbi:MAG TPA: CHAP domain-containing protein [Ktedonobacteraceae bacterium]|jgi:surface antigen|nr:CHAP domain-containing protein [Ktedonobacteraceae bacterium]
MSFTQKNSDSSIKQDVNTQSLSIAGAVPEHSHREQLSVESSTGSLASPDAEQLDFPTESLVEQLDFPTNSQSGPLPVRLTASSGMTQDIIIPSAVTRQLAQTGALTPIGGKDTTGLRKAVVIPGSRKKSAGVMTPARSRTTKRRMLTHLAITLLLVFIVGGVLLTVAPISHGQTGLSIFQPSTGSMKTSSNNSGLIAQQAATATAVMQDGYTPPKPITNNQFLPTPPPSLPASIQPAAPPATFSYSNAASGDNFPYGQCTYWADYRYHQLTGVWVDFSGNADAWGGNAAAAGWVQSSTPHSPSIIVLQPGVQGAGGYGHVAFVESIHNGTVTTSDMNWAGSGANVVDVTFSYPASGVSFIWAPGH